MQILYAVIATDSAAEPVWVEHGERRVRVRIMSRAGLGLCQEQG